MGLLHLLAKAGFFLAVFFGFALLLPFNELFDHFGVGVELESLNLLAFILALNDLSEDSAFKSHLIIVEALLEKLLGISKVQNAILLCSRVAPDVDETYLAASLNLLGLVWQNIGN